MYSLRFCLTFQLILVCSCIQNQDDIYYSGSEANQKIFQSYAIKDASCGKNHVFTTVLFGKVKISDVNACIKSIEFTSCLDWQTNDPTPARCKSINYVLQ